MSVKRYTCWKGSLFQDNNMLETPDGGYVRFIDHAAEVARLEAERAELVGVLVDVIRQATWNQEPANLKADDDPEDTWSISVGDHYDSGALSAYAAGLRLLARLGKVRIVSQYGRSVIAVDAALSQPQPCKTCGGCGELVDGSGLFKGSGPTTEPCPDCQPQQKEKGGKP